MAIQAEPQHPRPAAWVATAALLLLFGAEFIYFDVQTTRHVTWVYPRWNDQIQYLSECYTGYAYRLANGFWPGIWQTIVNPSAQGTLHDFFGVLVFNVAGPSRSAVLSLNMLALITWQLALFLAMTRLTGSQVLAWAAIMLPVSLRWLWNGWAGSMADFRLDHLGMCALGTSLALGLLTDGFRSAAWSAFFGFAVGVTLLTRFITGPYFVLIFFGLMVCLWFSPPQRPRRLGNFALAAFLAGVVAAPIFWINRESVWNYYYIGHYFGPESGIRNPHMGLVRSLRFVWGTLARDHLGAFFWWLAASGGFVLAAGAWLGRAAKVPRQPPRPDWWIIGGLFLLAPATVLTLHPQKSEITIDALVPGAIVLLLAVWFELWRRNFLAWPGRVVAVGALLAGGGFFVARQISPAYDAAFEADARKVNILADYIYTHGKAAKLANPGVAVDQVTDCLDGQVLRVITYERHHEFVPFIMKLPTGIMEEKEEVLLQRVVESDFVFLTEDGPVGGWPYDRQMRALLPKTQAWCEAHLKLVERFTLFGRRMVLYQRPEIP